MKRRLALLAGAAMLSTVGTLAPASPASATAPTDACVGTGNVTLSLGLGYPVGPNGLNPANLVNFAFSVTAGACATKGIQTGGIFATGHVHGWCGHSTGSGVTANGAEFHFVSVGGMLVIFGHLVGIVNAIPDPTTGGCLNKAATRFLVTGVVALQGVALLDFGGTCGLPPTWNCL